MIIGPTTAAAMARHALPGIEVTTVLSRSSGQLNTVYEVQRSSDPVILKIYPLEWAWKQTKEVYVYGLLAEPLRGSVPTILHAEPAGARFGNPFTVLTMLPGEPMSESTGGDIRSRYRRLGELLRAIHQIPQPSFGYLTDHVLDPLPTNDEYLRRQFAKKLHEFSELNGDPSLHAAISRYLRGHRDFLTQCAAPTLCHNDFHEGNILVTGSAVAGFIDVENAIAADPLMDIAKIDCYSIRGDPVKLAGLLDGYGELPDHWQQRVEVYRLYHALELWDWFAAIRASEPLDGLVVDIRAIVS